MSYSSINSIAGLPSVNITGPNASYSTITIASGFFNFFGSNLATDSAGNIFVNDSNGSTFEIAANSNTSTTIANNLGNNFAGPTVNGVTVDSQGNIFVATENYNYNNNNNNNNNNYNISLVIDEFSAANHTQTTYLNDTSFITLNNNYGYIDNITIINEAIDSAGNIYVATANNYNNINTTNNGTVYEISATNQQVTTVATGFATGNNGGGNGGELGLAVDNQGNIYVGDNNGNVSEIHQPSLPLASQQVNTMAA